MESDNSHSSYSWDNSTQFSRNGVSHSTKFLVYEGQRFIRLEKILKLSGVSELKRRRISTDAFLEKNKVEWMWFRPDHEPFARFVRLTNVLRYVNAAVRTGAVSTDMASVWREWLVGTDCTQAEVGEDSRKRRRPEDDAGAPPNKSLRLEDDEEFVFSDYEEDDEEEMEGFGEGSAEEEGEVDDATDNLFPQGGEALRYPSRLWEHAAQVKMRERLIAAGAELLVSLPSQDIRHRTAVLAEMSNQFEAMKYCIEQTPIPGMDRRLRLARTGTQVRVSERLAAYAYNPADIPAEVYKDIGKRAAEIHYQEYGMYPWRVPVWVGDTTKLGYFYSEHTAHCIDQAIEELVDDEGTNDE